MATIQEINSTIMFGDLTNDELDSVISAIKFRRASLTRNVRRNLSVGDNVKFTSNRTGQTYTGTVERVKIKYVLVKTAQNRFNVPANMLTVV